MNNTSLDLSDKIDPQTCGLLAMIKQTAESLRMPFFVIGATARDLILEFGYGIPTGRMTKDVDLAVMIKRWKDYEQLKDALAATGEFTPDPRSTHRLVYQKTLPIDVIPFGPIAAPTGTITWPNEDTSMTVLGFQEIMDHSISVRIRDGLEVRVAPLAGIAIITEPTAEGDNELVFIVLRIRVALQDFQNRRLRLWGHQLGHILPK